MEKFTFIDLFAGIGGFRLALESIGGECVFSSEFDKKARETYIRNFGEPLYGDITCESVTAEIPESFDILCGGFPCQPFSVAGLKKGFSDERGSLFFNIVEITEKHRPKVVFLENVKNLLTFDKGGSFKTIRETLENMGYKVFYKVLNAREYSGVPQNRERLFIVAFDLNQIGDCGKFVFPERIPLETSVRDLLDEDIENKYYYGETSAIYPVLRENVTDLDTVYQWRRKYVRENKKGVCPTLTANMGMGGHNVPIILDDEGVRRLTPRECLRLQGFPESFVFPDEVGDMSRYKQVGNSVVVPLVKRIGEEILKILR